jgi:hypothetical protein
MCAELLDFSVTSDSVSIAELPLNMSSSSVPPRKLPAFAK